MFLSFNKYEGQQSNEECLYLIQRYLLGKEEFVVEKIVYFYLKILVNLVYLEKF